jgi:type I restriction enzyme R subunit
MTFELRTEQLALAHLNGDEITIDILRGKIVADLNLLPVRLQEIKTHEEHLRWAVSEEFWGSLGYERIMDLQETFAPLMRYRRRRQQNLINLSLPDEIATRHWIVYGPGGEGAFAESYREKVEAFVRRLASSDPILRNIKIGKPITEEEVNSLARILERPDLYVTEDVLREIYEHPDAKLVDFLRHMLGVSQLPSRAEQIKEAFDDFIQAHSSFSAIQINFLRIIRSAIVTRNQLTASDLERPPFNRVGVVHQLFSNEELDEILSFVNSLAA